MLKRIFPEYEAQIIKSPASDEVVVEAWQVNSGRLAVSLKLPGIYEVEKQLKRTRLISRVAISFGTLFITWGAVDGFEDINRFVSSGQINYPQYLREVASIVGGLFHYGLAANILRRNIAVNKAVELFKSK